MSLDDLKKAAKITGAAQDGFTVCIHSYDGERGFDHCFRIDKAIGAYLVALLHAHNDSTYVSSEADKRDAMRWRFLEHGCQWVSYIPTNGEQRSFDPRNVTGYAGDLQDMRCVADQEMEKQLSVLRDGAAKLGRSLKR